MLFRTRAGSGRQARRNERDWNRSNEHHAQQADSERNHDNAMVPDPAHVNNSPPLSTPPLIEASPPSPAPPPPAASCAARRLQIGAVEYMQEAESTQPVADSAAVDQSGPESPDINCSQLSRHYPTPPGAPPKDQYHPPTPVDSESEADSPPPPAKIFRRGVLQYHASYKGPVPIAYVDTGLYWGGNHDYYEAFTQRDLLWVRRIDHLVRCLDVNRWRRQ